MPKWSEKLQQIADAIDVGKKGMDSGVDDFNYAMVNIAELSDIQKNMCNQNDIRKVSKLP